MSRSVHAQGHGHKSFTLANMYISLVYTIHNKHTSVTTLSFSFIIDSMRADSTLLEDLAIGERLALDLEVPRHGTVEKLLALFGRNVERRDIVRLPIGGD